MERKSPSGFTIIALLPAVLDSQKWNTCPLLTQLPWGSKPGRDWLCRELDFTLSKQREAWDWCQWIDWVLSLCVSFCIHSSFLLWLAWQIPLPRAPEAPLCFVAKLESGLYTFLDRWDPPLDSLLPAGLFQESLGVHCFSHPSQSRMPFPYYANKCCYLKAFNQNPSFILDLAIVLRESWTNDLENWLP